MSVTLARQIVTALHFPLDQLCIYQKAVVSMNKIVFVKKTAFSLNGYWSCVNNSPRNVTVIT